MAPPFLQILQRAHATSLELTGLHGGARSYAIASLAAQQSDRFMVVVAASDKDAEDIQENLGAYLGDRVLFVPAIEVSPYADVSPDKQALHQRLRALSLLSISPKKKDGSAFAVVLSANSLGRRVLAKEDLLERTFRIATGDELDRDDFIRALAGSGFACTTHVEEPGDFSVRGSVIDVFTPQYPHPVRIELFGDEVESVRLFELDSQRTLRKISSAEVFPICETTPSSKANVRSRILEAADAAHHPSKATRKLIEEILSGRQFVGIDALVPAFHTGLRLVTEYFPQIQECTWVFVEPDTVRATLDASFKRAEEDYSERLRGHRVSFAPKEHFVENNELEQLLRCPNRLEIRSTASPGEDSSCAVTQEVAPLEHHALRAALERGRLNQESRPFAPLVERVSSWLEQSFRIIISCQSIESLNTVRGVLDAYDIAWREWQPSSLTADEGRVASDVVCLTKSSLGDGFVFEAAQVVVLTDRDLFGARPRRTRRSTTAQKAARNALKGGVTDFTYLNVGDLLVHRVHGIGRYRGLERLPVQGVLVDFVHLEYRGGNLYLPVVRIGEVERYVGAEGITPRLDKLGGKTFETTKRAVSAKVHALAEQLLQVYAQRAALQGHAFPPPDGMMHAFEEAFPFDETPDQQAAIDDVCKDMGEAKAMDRLICGDVGYGKTEVALRAIWRAVLGGKQAALLAPTTVLVEQHYMTLCERFREWPVRIGRLSRFQKKTQQHQLADDLAAGRVDVVVGTHRLLSNDIRFKDLGLLVIDEEQRFGVRHKERFKKARTTLDVLALTATPIPRTLHLAMTGLRDLSIIATPPADRRSIRTFLAQPEDRVLTDAISNELARQGQVFFICPRIEASADGAERSLTAWAQHIQKLVPDARVGVAHGQMSSSALEKAMVAFIDGAFDVLVATTIVEAGLDIPRANTMFIARADQFGLSQLYQLRGRIGRSHQRAYCYLLAPESGSLSDAAQRRLETLQRYSELGAGFAIASHDLQQRGAGELLGAKQSGSIAAVGFDAYTKMLDDAVMELKGTPIHSELDPELNVDIPAYIPEEYVSEPAQRVALYKRFASVTGDAELADLLAELGDLYGAVPKEVLLLGELMGLRCLARQLGAQALELSSHRFSVTLGEYSAVSPIRLTEMLEKEAPSYKLAPGMRVIRTIPQGDDDDCVKLARAALKALLGCTTSVRTRTPSTPGRVGA